ncbi:MAG: tryptophan--tRNA ligase, partial [Candidatus Hodarchaeales archaeon]
MHNTESIVDKNIVNAFGGGVSDYDRLISEFGITPIEDILPSLPKQYIHYYMTRGIMFGHTDLERILEAIEKKEEFAIMTGIKPSSNEYHIGNLVTCREVLHFQKMGGKLFFCIADIESYLDGKTSLEEAEQNAIENIADLIALGLNLDQAYVYRQSQQQDVLKLGCLLSAHVTYNTMKSIYGQNKLGVYNAALIQVADILLPQLVLGPIPTVIPIGADQAPHARLARDLSRKKPLQDKYNFVLPSFTYHKLIKGLDNSCKMSKR